MFKHIKTGAKLVGGFLTAALIVLVVAAMGPWGANNTGMPRFIEGDTSPDFQFDTPWENGLSFSGTSAGRPAVLVFLRYLGCPVCQMNMATLKREVGLIDQKGARLFVILQSAAATVAGLTSKADWPFTIICDPEGIIFHQYRVEPGGTIKLLHPAGLVAAVRARLNGYKHGKYEGKETQLPAVLIVTPDGRITYAYYGKHISDVPSPSIIASHIG